MSFDNYPPSAWEHLRAIVEPLKSIDPKGRLLIKRGTIVSMNPHVGDLTHGDVLIEGDRITAIAPSIAADGAEVIDAKDMIVMPGFVDSHRHAWEGQLRRIDPNSPTLMDYLKSTHFSFATHYRPEDMYIGNLITALGAIDAGITTMVDNSHNARSPAHSDASVDALEDAGIRAVYAPGKPLAGEWAQHWPQDLGRLKQERFDSEDQLVTMAMMSQWDRETWAAARAVGLRIITEFLGEDMGKLLPGLKEEGLLGPDNIFNHCTGLTDEQWGILRETGVNVDVCPRSDAQYGLEEGLCVYQRAIDNGIAPAISTDVEASYGGDMFAEMRAAYIMQRAQAQNRRFKGDETSPAAVSVRSILETATINGARVAGLAEKTGSLAPGKKADIVLIRADDLNLYPSNNAIGTIVHAAERSNVDTVIIGGRVRKSGGKLIGLNFPALKQATEASRSHLFAAVNYTPDQFADVSPEVAQA
ncbi:cytosine/adenosine deaminase-related metal-dependent hydrolase [Paraburkholderia sp. BL6669N2]|uniref:amidohydrolase family protein n=1 Tax=Paraburkholderia sp. BL6669N2 TaxID=1938807 RepID=UPI000E23B9D0|nr:amidohydrolase family protein [Paraburkholderia sp. BL6669N2]REG51040.1 cytosine/adenosine deaminase-related metal-dependent hydrolase [Paraburkholderia sp. BL6669N2]